MSIQFKQSLILGVCLMSSSWSFAAVKEYQLVIDESPVNLTGKSLKRISVNGQFPAPLLEFEEGDDAVIRVKNNLKKQDSSIHWHGLLLPGLMDGVPGFNGFNGIQPKSEFVYKFKVRQSGTYWYHAHSKGQEQDGLYGALVIYPKDKKPLAQHEKAERDYVVMLSDFHEQSSEQIQKNLKISAEYYQNQRETVADVWKQVQREGLKAAWQDRSMWNQMRMLKTDLSDVTGYTFLINGKTPEQNWTGMFKPNEKVRLRFINASAMSFFDIRIPHLKMTVVSADGQPIKPVPVDEFRIGTAETYDVIVEPKAGHYQIEAESIDRSGYAIGTLHNELTPMAQSIHMPAPRPRSLLTMEDMGHGSEHSGMDHSQMNHETMPEMDHSKMSHEAMPAMDHSKMNPEAMPEMDHSKMNHAAMAGMDHSAMQGMDHSNMAGMDHSAMAGMDHSQMTMGGMSGMAGMGMGGMMTHANDVKYDAYLVNDRSLADPELVQVDKGARVRLRIINGGTATAFWIDPGMLESVVIATDGSPCQPLSAPAYPIAQGQRLDLIVTIPAEGGAFPIFAQVEAMPGVKVVMLSTFDNPTYVARAVAAGGFVYLEAPRAWTEDELTATGLVPYRHLKAGAVHAHLLRPLGAGAAVA